jgi:hypothetical protein
MSSFKIPFGLKKERLVEVDDVPSGLRCDCVCPGCKRDLIARKGEVNAHHFAHAHGKDSDLCEYGAETAIHLMAKQILCEEKRIFAPETLVERNDFDDRGNSHTASRAAHSKGSLIFDEVISEKSFGGMIPDILSTVGGEPFIIEIAVTHFCGKDKISTFREKHCNVLEVDLRSFTKSLPTKEDLRSYLIEEEATREWLSLKSYEDVEKQVEKELRDKIAAANERNKSKTVTRVERTKPMPQSSGTHHRSELITYHKADTKSRWFAFPSCNEKQKAYPYWQDRLPEEVFLFSCSWEEAPWEVTSVPCPFCNAPVTVR